MSIETMPDVEGAVRDWLRVQPSVSALVGTRVFFGIPDNPSWPLVTVRRVGGGDDPSEVPIDVALLQIDCWGGVDPAGHGLKADATAVKNAVRGVLHPLRSATALNATVTAYGAVVESDIFLADPNDNHPRYSLTVQIAARAT